MESFPASVTFGRCFLHLFKTTCAIKKCNAVFLFFDSFLGLVFCLGDSLFAVVVI